MKEVGYFKFLSISKSFRNKYEDTEDRNILKRSLMELTEKGMMKAAEAMDMLFKV